MTSQKESVYAQFFDAYSRNTIDYVKIGSEYVKIIISNLSVLNGGGVAAIPIMINLKQFVDLKMIKKIQIFGWPAVFFLLGFCLANVTAYFVNELLNRTISQNLLDARRIVLDIRDSGQFDSSKILVHIDNLQNRFVRFHFRATTAGWGSFGAFMVAAVLFLKGIMR